MKEKDINSLDHTRWRCQYHVVFAPKYRRMGIYGEKSRYRKNTGTVMKTKENRYHRSRTVCRPCTYADKCTDKIHRVVNNGISEGKSSLIIFDRHAKLKYKYGNRHFWAKGYFVGYSRTKQKANTRVHTKSIDGR